MGKLIVIDGLDGSGKATQAELLFNKLKSIDEKTIKLSFPNYSDESSALIKMYLAGNFGSSPEEVNPYAASSFYAVDRYASYKKYWEKKYLSGYNIICDRYVTSNIIHQMAKLKNTEWEYFVNWVEDYEYNKLKLPKPDKVIYLDVDLAISQNLIKKRCDLKKIKKDIHEKDIFYLERCKQAADYISELEKWNVINCCNNNGNMYDVEFINEQILKILF